MIINHNKTAMTAHRHLLHHQRLQHSSMERLASGLRINRAGDDAAGLAISEKMRGQIRGLNQAVRNAQDGISLIQTAEGALNETHAILQRMRELAAQAANDTNTTSDRVALQTEINQLIAEIDRIGNSTQFNTQTLLDGSRSNGKNRFSFQIGANAGQSMTIEIADMRSMALHISKEPNSQFFLDVTSHEKATAALGRLDLAIEKVSSQRSSLGASQNRLQFTISNLLNTSENLQAAESRIRDVDMAREMIEYTKRTILSQTALAMLAQANQQAQSILRLLN